MLLAQPDIREAVAAKRIVFDPPLEEEQWGPASVDLRLGFGFTKLRRLPGFTISVAKGLGALSGAGFWDTRTLNEHDALGKRESFFIEPGEFVLAMTYERISVPEDLIAIVEGRSTYARVGLSMHQTAPWIQPGWNARPIVLEILNIGPNTIQLTPLTDRPCQLSFFTLSTGLCAGMTYGSRSSDAYVSQEHPLDVKKKP